MRLLLATIFALVPLLAAQTGVALPAAQLAWRNIGPAVSGGRLGALAGTDRDAALYYAGAAGGGIWKTSNSGQTWSPVFDTQDVASIGALAIDPNDERTVWAGTGEANPRNDVSQGDGVYKTTDGGKSWTRVLPLRNALVSSVVIDPMDSRRVLVGALGDPFADGTDRGVYRTTDGGATWSKVLFAGLRSGISDMAMDPSHPDTVYAGMWEFRRTGWSLQSGGDQDGLYRSTDGGATWNKLSGNGLPAGIEGRIAIAIAPSNPKRIYALIQSPAGLLWRSDDAGTTWALVSKNTLIDERPYYFSHLFVDPADANRLWSVSVHLTVSTDAGKTFHVTGRNIHGDHHAMWIAADGKRIVEGNDGGVAFSFDGGSTWTWDTALPISQLYHVGVSREHPYRVCAPLQDNGTYCAPANPLDREGSAAAWLRVGGGDGTWGEFDPRNPQLVWMAFGGGDIGGDLYIHDFASGQTRSVAPYMRDQNAVDPANLAHRFNWETPIAFDPFDSRVAYTAGEALFATGDRGYHWRALSGDLTRNVKAHQVVTGGITLDATGAETSDTILAIAPSAAKRGEIWIGTDDGYVQLTRDGGAHWRNVTPKGIEPFGRFGSISPGRSAGVAYAVYDRHMVGDRTPYVFATRDYGAHWKAIAAGLPAGDEARSILVDPRNPHLLYAGLERSMWASWNDGAAWTRMENLPPASVRDIRIQPDDNDLLIATHGRGIYVIDDATPLQQLDRARAAGTYLFPVRAAVLWALHGYSNTPPDGKAPPYGAIVTYYLTSPATRMPTAEIVDSRGDVVRHFATHLEQGKPVPDLSSDAGMNRFSWDLATDGATPWTFAAPWNRAADGVLVPPGNYTLRLHVDGREFDRTIVVKPDPRSPFSPSQYASSYALQRVLLEDLSNLDTALERLSEIERDAPTSAAATRARALIASMTSNPANDQDDDFMTDLLRERLQSFLGSFSETFAPPTAAQIDQAKELHRQAVDRVLAAELFEAQLPKTKHGAP
jgi:photosystem II stability/assembly factor-like uncharacterized protein